MKFFIFCQDKNYFYSDFGQNDQLSTFLTQFMKLLLIKSKWFNLEKILSQTNCKKRFFNGKGLNCNMLILLKNDDFGHNMLQNSNFWSNRTANRKPFKPV